MQVLDIMQLMKHVIVLILLDQELVPLALLTIKFVYIFVIVLVLLDPEIGPPALLNSEHYTTGYIIGKPMRII
jgi:hypothetical protein